MGNWTLDNSPGYVLMRDLLEESIDFELLKQSSIKFFVTATNVRTGLPRVFRNEQMHADVLLASACLPLMHRAVEIDGDAHWDGGFSGNSLLTPIVRESPARDTLLVQINRIERLGVPEDSARYPQPPERDLFN